MVLWLDVSSEALTPLLTQHMEGLQSGRIVLDIVLNSGHIVHDASLPRFSQMLFHTLRGELITIYQI